MNNKTSLKAKVKTVFGIIKVYKNWPTYFLDYFKKIKKKNITITLRNGVKFLVRSRTYDIIVLNEMWLKNTYNPKGFEIKENDTIVDIGAHIAVFSIYAAILAKKGRVYAFEPMPENYSLLKKNISINHLKNIIPINQAVDSKSGITELFINEENTGGNSLLLKNSEKSNRIQVHTTSIQEFMKKYSIDKIDILKMDCEGAEYEILFKCPKNTLNKISKITMEYHPIDKSRNVKTLKRFLEKNGFKVKYTISDSWMLYAKR